MTSDPFQLRREKSADTVTLHRVSFLFLKSKHPGASGHPFVQIKICLIFIITKFNAPLITSLNDIVISLKCGKVSLPRLTSDWRDHVEVSVAY